MIISEEQIRKSLAYLQSSPPRKRAFRGRDRKTLPLDSYRLHIRELPDVRADLIGHIKEDVSKGQYVVPADEIAEKILGRAIGDMLR